jgi:hypothetical protein
MAPPSRQPMAGLPSLLVFGPQTNLPSYEVLAELRQDLIDNPQMNGLLKAIRDLPNFWQTVTGFDPTLSQIQGTEHLGDLLQWIDNGVLPQHLKSLPNISALPLTVTMQVLLYIRYLNELQIENPHQKVLQHIQGGGIQGFCVGFLTALVVNCSENENDIAEVGATAIRLAVCVGAYVDQDSLLGDPPNQSSCIAVRWRTGFEETEVVEIMQSYCDVRRQSTQTT